MATIGDHERVKSARILLIALGVAVCAWYVVGIRQAREVADATSVVAGHGASRARQRDAAALLQAASALNPDREAQILQARLQIAEGHVRQAQRTLSAVTRAEPMNLEAWIWLAGAALGDPPLARAALAHIDRLDPLDGRALRR